MNDWRAHRRPGQVTRDPKVRPKRICPLCKAQVIWAQMQAPKRQGRRAYVPCPIDRCTPGAGDIALSNGLFAFGDAPIAERVGNGTGYRLHREYCPALATSSNNSAAAPKAFSAANFQTKKPARGGNR